MYIIKIKKKNTHAHTKTNLKKRETEGQRGREGDKKRGGGVFEAIYHS